jgi:topoisomerase-4 subunit A
MKKPKTKQASRPASDLLITQQDLMAFGREAMGIYAEEVNLNRAVPDLIDGLKPVQRRIAWAASRLGKDLVKTARLSGDVIGRYHPHGSAAVEGAIVTMMHQNQSLMLGRGNWGSLVDPAAAARYTNCTLSHYGWSFFNDDYANKEVTRFVPNYDDTTVEPVSLPALMPNVLINGGEGIGVGTTTKLPTFTPESLISVMTRLLKGEKLQAIDFAKGLKPINKYGGVLVSSKENKQAWFAMFKGPKANVAFQARLEIDRDHKLIDIDDWPPGLNPIKFITKVRTLKEVDSAYNHKGATGFRIEMRRDHNYTQFDALVAKIQKMATVRRAFCVNVTHRTCTIDDGIVSYSTKYLSLSVPQVLITWLKERLALEQRSLAYRVKKQDELIAYSELLIFVANNADAIIKVIRTAMEPQAALMAKFKLPDFQAAQILDLQLRRISKLDQTAVKTKLAEQKVHLKQLKAWQAKPRVKIIEDFKTIELAMAKDRKFEQEKGRKMDVS